MPTAVLVLPPEHRCVLRSLVPSTSFNADLSPSVDSFDPQVAPSYSRWVPPKWMLQHASNPPTPRRPNANGLGEEWNPKKPSFRGIDLVRLLVLFRICHLLTTMWTLADEA